MFVNSRDAIAVATELRDATRHLAFGGDVAMVYHPLDYAWRVHQQWLERYGQGRKRVLLIGMNPGPFGMAQTGIPFGAVNHVRDWMGLDAPIDQPGEMHPKRPITGWATTRIEVSGDRLWTWAAARFGTAERFFAEFFVINYCPLCFLGETGRNLTPDKLPAAEREPLQAICDDALGAFVRVYQPEWVLGVGKFAANRIRAAITDDVRIGTVLHPSPASPAANRGWAEAAERQLQEQGVI
ncbi:MAG: single-stranded DNA-binding protein [Candidatus Dadabacteria bacterium]|nr:MAG: single-stranded DNA-binding protein [Candidatus Dadabacteria bacterium]